MIYHYSYHYRAQSSDLPRHEQLLLYSPSNQALVSFHPIQLHLFVSVLWCICYIVVHRADEYLTTWHNCWCNLVHYCEISYNILIKSFPPTSGLRSSCMHVCQALEPAVLVCQALPMHLYRVQTWNLSKILHRRIFRLKIWHRQFHLISTVFVRKNTKN